MDRELGEFREALHLIGLMRALLKLDGVDRVDEGRFA